MVQKSPDRPAIAEAPQQEVVGKKPRGGSLRRWLTFLLGVWVMSIGIALSVPGQLGTSPSSNIPAVIDAATDLRIGSKVVALNIVFVFIQILILPRRLQAYQLVQLSHARIFGML